jgi:hypothetical protein
MHCPRCGQQQISEETKFCSKCGFPLSVVADVMAHGGSLPQLDQLNSGKKKFLTRRNGMGFSLIWLLFFLLVMTPFWGIMDVEKLAGLSAIAGIFGGLVLFLSSVIFLEGPPKPQPYYPYPPMPHQLPQMSQMPQVPMYQQQMGGQQYQPNALPPQQSMPVQTYTPPAPGSWRDTNDFGRGSVTEDSTRLLTKEEEQH